MRKSNKIYKITSQQKGLVVILDMMAENVHQEVKRVFEEIGYTVKEVSVDSFRSIEELKKSLRDCFLDCKNYDSAILIMTGKKGNVDGFYVGDKLLDIVQIDKCIRNNSLKLKPKLVFLQVDSPRKDPNYISRPPRDFTYPDTFIACTVCYGFQGANQFFETLVEVFSNYAWEEDLLSLMTSVKYELSRKFRDKEYEHSYLPKFTSGNCGGYEFTLDIIG
ncbi:hypothetical protein AC249_AIPGENE7541 [Exaiptasia diaphana]|nr:hypothetical protein AC249_AIPGENE7541 [Exaiptasia diaphana]